MVALTLQELSVEAITILYDEFVTASAKPG